MGTIEDRQQHRGPDARGGQTAEDAVLPASGRSLLGYVRLAALLAGLYGVSRYNYLLFHAAAELFSIVIAGVVFIIAWNARRQLDSHFYLFMGIASLFVGIIDLLHVLSYKGMGVFPLIDANVPTQLWVAGRYVQSVSLLVAPVFLRRSMMTGPVIAAFGAITAALVLSIFFWTVFPASYVEGVGLTVFKRGSEYVICLILIGAIAHLLRSRGEIDRAVMRLLVASFVATVASELLFTVYVGLSDLALVLGHLVRIISFYLLYRAMIETALMKPQVIFYRKMQASEETLRKERNLLKNYLDIAGVVIVALRPDQTVAMINRKGESVLGYPREDILGRNWFDLVVPQDEREANKAAFNRMLQQGLCREVESFESALVARNGERRLFAWHHTVLPDEDGNVSGTLSSGEDITERKKFEADRELLIQDLRTVLERVKMLSGMLPICSSCKKVRDDKGYWSQVETYIEEHSNAHFTHGICPDCAVRLYPHLFKDGMPQL